MTLFKIIPHQLIIPLTISLLALFLIFTLGMKSLTPVYHTIMIICGGYALTKYQRQIAALLQSIPLSSLARFILLGYVAVIAEEMLVGLIYSLNEGFTVSLMLERMRQFISFNILAFTGFIWGSYFVYRKIAFQSYDLLLIAGSWGLFSESIYLHLLAYPLPAIALILPTMCVYAIIIAPACLSLRPEERGQKHVNIAVRAILLWTVMFVLSVPPVLLLNHLRDSYPHFFPECHYIPCS